MAAAATADRPTTTMQILDSRVHPTYDFDFTDFLVKEHKFGLSSDRATCKAFMQGHCPNGDGCPDKHHVPSNYQS